MATALLGRGFQRSLARAVLPLGILFTLTSACGSSKSDFDEPSGQGATGGSGGTASGTLGTLLARCNGLCDDAASAKCGHDVAQCHTGCSDSLDVFQHCTETYDALLDCAEALSNVCPLYDADAKDPPCASEFGDYTHCATVCADDKNDPICT